MASAASSSNGRPGDGLRDRRRVSIQILTSNTQYPTCHNLTALQSSENETPESISAETGVDIIGSSQKVASPSLSRQRNNIDDNRSQSSPTRSSDSVIYSRLLEVPQRYAGYTPFSSPTESSSSSPESILFNGPPVFRRGASPIPSSPSCLSPLREYHLDAVDYHRESATYHDTVAQYYDSAAEYHDRALLYHSTQARIRRVRFFSPVATFFPFSGESLLYQSNPRPRQGSMEGSIHGSDPEGSESRLSDSTTLRPASIMSPTDPNHSNIPAVGDLAPPAAQGNCQGASATIKWIIRAKTPSFSSDSEQEAYNGPSVTMNADKCWEPDVKKLNKKVNRGSSHPASSISNESTAKHLSGSSSSTVPLILESCEERAKIAETRVRAAEELQKKDRLWAVDADERAVNAESCLKEIRTELARSRDIITGLENQLIRARSDADAAEKDFKDIESEIEAFENRAMEFEKEAFEFKTKLLNLRKYTDDLQKHHNKREEDFMACNKEWHDREEDFIKYCLDLELESDERAARAKEEMAKLEQKFEDLIHDRALIAKTLTAAFQQMRQSGKLMSKEDVNRLLAWATTPPELKKGKEVGESVIVLREKARGTLEGQAFTPSLDTGAFEAGAAGESSSGGGAAKPVETEKEPGVSKETQTSPVDDVSGVTGGPSRFQHGVARLPACSKGAWYAKMKTVKE